MQINKMPKKMKVLSPMKVSNKLQQRYDYYIAQPYPRYDDFLCYTPITKSKIFQHSISIHLQPIVYIPNEIIIPHRPFTQPEIQTNGLRFLILFDKTVETPQMRIQMKPCIDAAHEKFLSKDPGVKRKEWHSQQQVY